MNDTDLIQKTVSDISRANATKLFTVKCTACAESHTQTLGWLQTKRFVCPSCGGRLDDAPLHQLTLTAMRQLGKGAVAPKEKPPGRVKPKAVEPFAAAKGYQLVLQFHGDSLPDFDTLVALEDELIERLGDSADVDGHDVGSGQTNIFIFTPNPAAAFTRIRPLLERRKQLPAVTAAYREVEGEHYTVIWPECSQQAFAIV